MKLGIVLSASAVCITVCLFVAGCGGNGNVPGGVVQAQTASTPAILAGSCPQVTATNTPFPSNFLFPLGNQQSDCSSQGQGMPMPSAGILKNLRFATGLGADNVSNGTVTVFVNGSATTLTCAASATISSGDTTAKCSDTTHQINVAAGDEVAIKVVMQTGTFADVRATLEKQ